MSKEIQNSKKIHQLQPLSRSLGLCVALCSPLLVQAVSAQVLQEVAAGRDESIDFNLPAAPLATSLDSFVEVTGWQIGYSAELTSGKNSPELKGQMTPTVALSQLLSGTGLTYELAGSGNTVILRKAADSQVQIDAQTGALVLPPVKVSAGLEQEGLIYEQPNTTSIISRTSIERSNPRHASEALQATPGVASITNEQNPAVAVQVRGLKDFGRVNMNIDGMRQNFQRSGHQQRNGEMFFDTELLSSVEISKGPSSTAGGAAATGGVATFRTLEVIDLLQQDENFGGRFRSSSGLGSWDNGLGVSGSLAVAARADAGADVLVTYSERNSDAYEPGQNGQAIIQPNDIYETPASIVNGTGQDMESLLVKGGWDLAENQRLQLTLIDLDADYSESSLQNGDQAYRAWTCEQDYHAGEDYCIDFEYDPENVYPITSTNSISNRNIALDYQLRSDNPLLALNLKAYYVDTENHYSSVSQDVLSITRTETIGGQAANLSWIELGKDFGVELHLGIEGFEDTTSPDTESTTLSGDEIVAANGNTPEGNRRILSGFSRATFQYGDWLEVTPGLRYDNYRLWGTTNYQTPGKIQFLQVDVDHEQDKWLPTLGVAINPTEYLQLFASGGLGWRPPAITETLISGATPGHAIATYSYPNWSLEPEETTSYEIGFNINADSLLLEGDRFSFKLAYFDSETENYIYLSSGIGTPGADNPSLFASMYANALEDIRFKGEELSIDYQQGIWYGSLAVTHMERIGNLSSAYYPAGGEPDDDAWQGKTINDNSLYYPIPPEYTATLNLGAKPLSGALDLGMQLRYTDESGAHYGIDLESTEVINSSLVLDLYGEYQLSDAFKAGLSLKNITDRQYIQAQGDAVVKTYAPGKTVSASLSWTF